MSARVWSVAVPILLLVLPCRSIARERCDPGSDSTVATLRAEIGAACPCDRTYRSCVRGLVRNAIATHRLPVGCRSITVGCLLRSICGRRPGAVVCCSTIAAEGHRCRVARGVADCRESDGREACPEALTCCDACASGGCVSRPLVPPIDLTSTWVLAGEETEDTCGEDVSPFNSTVTISQHGTMLAFIGDVSSGGPFSAWQTADHFLLAGLPFGTVPGPGPYRDCVYDFFVNLYGTYDSTNGSISVRQARVYFPVASDPRCPLCSVTWEGTMSRVVPE